MRRPTGRLVRAVCVFPVEPATTLCIGSGVADVKADTEPFDSLKGRET